MDWSWTVFVDFCIEGGRREGDCCCRNGMEGSRGEEEWSTTPKGKQILEGNHTGVNADGGQEGAMPIIMSLINYDKDNGAKWPVVVKVIEVAICLCECPSVDSYLLPGCSSISHP